MLFDLKLNERRKRRKGSSAICLRRRDEARGKTLSLLSRSLISRERREVSPFERTAVCLILFASYSWEAHEDVDPFLFVLRLSVRSSLRVGLIEESREKKKL